MKLQIESTMEVICSNSSFIDIAVVHNNAMITKKNFAKYPKTFLGTLGYFTVFPIAPQHVEVKSLRIVSCG